MIFKKGSTGKVLKSVLAVSLTLALALILAPATAAQPTGVSGDREAATEESYDGITSVDAENVWAVGTDGTIVYYDGLTWTDQESGTNEDLTGVDAVDENHVWAVGTNGTILHYDGTDWTSQPSGTNNVLTDVSAVDASHVWAVGTQGTILFYNGSTWSSQNSGTTKDIYGVFALDAKHVWAVGAGGTILFYNGSTWSKQTSGTGVDLLGVSGVDASHVWAVGANGTILFFNGSSWTAQESGTNKDLYAVSAIDNNDVWASGQDGTMLHFNGEEWSPHESGTDQNLYDVTPVGDNEVISVGDEKTVVVMEDPEPETWYLAEGTTAWGFETYITIENPNDEQVTADVTYMPTGQDTVEELVTLPAHSQTTLTNSHLVSVMGGMRDFSTRVECKQGKTIAVDRTMSWTGQGAVSPDGHSSVGVTAPSNTWYLPEGSSAWGFECFLLIQNPNEATATCAVTYMIEGGEPQEFVKTVSPNSRATFNMAEDIGSKDASIKVEGDVAVIPERAMYRNNRREGHDSIGTTTPSRDYYLAEGTSAWGFTTFVLIQNPSDTQASVDVTYMVTGEGAVPHPGNPVVMAPNSRKTIRVNNYLPEKDFSTQVHGDKPIIAERAMYWDNGLGEACHDSIGMSAPHTNFYLPDGQTTEGFETFTLIQNPNDNDVTVEITYMTPTGEGNVTKAETVGANSRVTFNMAVHSGLEGRAAIMVTSKTSGKRIMVERAMYWNSRGAGTDTIGGYSD